jgi:hypothetical protein
VFSVSLCETTAFTGLFRVFRGPTLFAGKSLSLRRRLEAPTSGAPSRELRLAVLRIIRGGKGLEELWRGRVIKAQLFSEIVFMSFLSKVSICTPSILL